MHPETRITLLERCHHGIKQARKQKLGIHLTYTPPILNYSSLYIYFKSNFSNFDQVYRKMHQHLQHQISL